MTRVVMCCRAAGGVHPAWARLSKARSLGSSVAFLSLTSRGVVSEQDFHGSETLAKELSHLHLEVLVSVDTMTSCHNLAPDYLICCIAPELTWCLPVGQGLPFTGQLFD